MVRGLLVFGMVAGTAGTVLAGEGAAAEHHGNPQWWLMALFLIFCGGVAWLAQRRYLVKASDGTIKPAYAELQEFSFFLLSGTIVAQLWAHGDPDGYHATMHVVMATFSTWMGKIVITPHFLVNEVFMVFFFGIAAKELTEAILKKNGALNWKKPASMLPALACIGGVVGPAILFTQLCSPERSGAWAVPCATDIAFAWLGARAIWGKDHPAVIFLLALAIGDDFIGMGIIAAFYPQKAFDPYGLLVLGAGMATAWSFSRLSKSSPFFRNWLLYLLPVIICWMGLLQTGLHAALAMVFVIPFMPMKEEEPDEGLFGEEDHMNGHHVDTLNAFEHRMKPFVDAGLFFFGLSNAGVAWYGTGAWDQDSTAVLLGLGIGKTVGITLFTVVAFVILKSMKLVTGLPTNAGVRMEWRDVPVIGLLGAMGFTVALFVADAAGGHADLKLGALGSFAFLGLAVLIGKIVCRPVVPEPAEQHPHENASPVPHEAGVM